MVIICHFKSNPLTAQLIPGYIPMLRGHCVPDGRTDGKKKHLAAENPLAIRNSTSCALQQFHNNCEITSRIRNVRPDTDSSSFHSRPPDHGLRIRTNKQEKKRGTNRSNCFLFYSILFYAIASNIYSCLWDCDDMIRLASPLNFIRPQRAEFRKSNE